MFQFTQTQYTADESVRYFPVTIELVEGNLIGFPITITVQDVQSPMSGSGSGSSEPGSGSGTCLSMVCSSSMQLCTVSLQVL